MKTPKLILAIVSLACVSSQGQTVLHWDANANFSDGVGGHGITNAWNAATLRWFNGVVNVAWADNSVAVFDGDTSGTANVFGSTFAPVVHSLVFSNVPGYRITSAPAPKITLTSGNIYAYADAFISANLTNVAGDVTTGIRKLGPARLTFGGNGNQAFGGLYVLEGTMVLEDKGGIGGSAQPLIVNGGTAELLNNQDVSGRFLYIGDNGARFHLPFETNIWVFQQNDGTNGTLTKTGAGVLGLGNNDNGGTAANVSLRSGATVIEEGTLATYTSVGSALGSGAVTVKTNATLAGPGLVQGSVTILEGTVSPSGSGATNVLALPNMTLAGGLDLSVGGTYKWELLSLADDATGSPRSDFDRISITNGSLVLGGSSSLSIEFAGTASAPDVGNPFWQQNHLWTIIALSETASNPSATSFASLQNATYPAGDFSVSVHAGGSVLLAYTTKSVAPPHIESIVNQSTNMLITWTSVDNRAYQVEYATNLVAPQWTAFTNLNAIGALTSVTDVPTNTARFYRVLLLP